MSNKSVEQSEELKEKVTSFKSDKGKDKEKLSSSKSDKEKLQKKDSKKDHKKNLGSEIKLVQGNPQKNNADLKFYEFVYEQLSEPLLNEFFAINTKYIHQKNISTNKRKLKQKYINCLKQSRLYSLLSSVAQGKSPYFTLEDVAKILANVDQTNDELPFLVIARVQSSKKSGWTGDTTADLCFLLTKTPQFKNSKDPDDPIRVLVTRLAPLPLADTVASTAINKITRSQVFEPLRKDLKKVIKQTPGDLSAFTNSSLTSTRTSSGEVSFSTQEETSLTEKLPKLALTARKKATKYYEVTINNSLKGEALLPDVIKNNWGKNFQISFAEFFELKMEQKSCILYNNEHYFLSTKVDRIDDTPGPGQIPVLLKLVRNANGCIYVTEIPTQDAMRILKSSATAIGILGKDMDGVDTLSDLIKLIVKTTSKLTPTTHMEYKGELFPCRVVAQVADITTGGGLRGNIANDIENEAKRKGWVMNMAIQLLSQQNDENGIAVQTAKKLKKKYEKKKLELKIQKEFFEAVLVNPALTFLSKLNVGYTPQACKFTYEIINSLSNECVDAFMKNQNAQRIFIDGILCLGYKTYKKGVRAKVSKKEVDVHLIEKDMLSQLKIALDKKHKQVNDAKPIFNKLIVLINDSELRKTLSNRLDAILADPCRGFVLAKVDFVDEIKSAIARLPQSKKSKHRSKSKEQSAEKYLNENMHLMGKLNNVDVIKKLIDLIKANKKVDDINEVFDQPVNFAFHRSTVKSDPDKFTETTNDNMSINEHAKKLGFTPLINKLIQGITADKSYNGLQFFNPKRSSEDETATRKTDTVDNSKPVEKAETDRTMSESCGEESAEATEATASRSAGK